MDLNSKVRLHFHLMNHLPSAKGIMSLEGHVLGIDHIFITEDFIIFTLLRGNLTQILHLRGTSLTYFLSQQG